VEAKTMQNFYPDAGGLPLVGSEYSICHCGLASIHGSIDGVCVC
jgi:hypothetical protein